MCKNLHVSDVFLITKFIRFKGLILRARKVFFLQMPDQSYIIPLTHRSTEYVLCLCSNKTAVMFLRRIKTTSTNRNRQRILKTVLGATKLQNFIDIHILVLYHWNRSLHFFVKQLLQTLSISFFRNHRGIFS